VIFHAILERTPTPPVRINAEIPQKLEEIINKCKKLPATSVKLIVDLFE